MGDSVGAAVPVVMLRGPTGPRSSLRWQGLFHAGVTNPKSLVKATLDELQVNNCHQHCAQPNAKELAEPP